MTRFERIRFYVMLLCFVASTVGGTLNVVYGMGPRWALLAFAFGTYGSAKVLMVLSRKAVAGQVAQAGVEPKK